MGPELVLKADAAVRIRQSFAANTVSLKLLSFQAWFLRKVARPPHKSAADVAGYDRTKGVPAASLVDALQDHCKALGKMQSHADFFALTGLEPVPEALLAELSSETSQTPRVSGTTVAVLSRSKLPCGERGARTSGRRRKRRGGRTCGSFFALRSVFPMDVHSDRVENTGDDRKR